MVFRPQTKPKTNPSESKEPPIIKNLLHWEYGRAWLSERDNTMEKRSKLKMTKPKKIRYNFQWWLEKRTKPKPSQEEEELVE